MQKNVGQMTLFRQKGFETDTLCLSEEEMTKLSGRNTYLEDVSKVLRTLLSNRKETDGGTFVVDSLRDWKPMERM